MLNATYTLDGRGHSNTVHTVIIRIMHYTTKRTFWMNRKECSADFSFL